MGNPYIPGGRARVATAKRMPDYSVIGRVLDARRAPVVGYRVHVYRAAGRFGSEEHLTDGLTDAGGRFTLRIADEALSGIAQRFHRSPKCS